MIRWAALGIIVLWLAGCGDDGENGGQSVTCQQAFEQMDFAADVSLGADVDTNLTRTCLVDFAGAPQYLADYGLESSCPDEASVILAFTAESNALYFDADGTDDIDNGDCLGAS